MSMLSLLRPRSFRRDERGVAAIEFAFIAPVALMFLGLAVIMGEALAIGQKVTLTARTIVDLVSQQDSVTSSQVTQYLQAAAFTMAPYDTTNLQMVVSEIQINASCAATVTWSQAYNWSGSNANAGALTAGSTFPLPAGMPTNCASGGTTTYIYGTVKYAFTPPGVGFVTGAITLNDVAYFSPRVSTTIPLTN